MTNHKKRIPRAPFRPLLAFVQRKKEIGRICIGGYAGCGNLGDDAILQGYLQKHASELDLSRVTVLSGNPRRDSRRFGVHCVHRFRPIPVFFSLLRAEKFFCGGGSLLQNQTGNRSLYYYLSLLRLAQLLGCKTSLLSGGIGPLKGSAQIRATVSALNACLSVELRDENSKRLLSTWGVRRELLHLSPDPALFLPPPPPSRLAFLLSENHISPSQRYFCAVLRPPASHIPHAEKILAAALRRISQAHDLIPLLAVFDPAHDSDFSLHVAKKCDGRLVRLREASDAQALLSNAQFALCMRLHALILSLSVHTPAIGLSHDQNDPKIKSFCLASAFPHLSLPNASIVTLVDLLEKVYLHEGGF